MRVGRMTNSNCNTPSSNNSSTRDLLCQRQIAASASMVPVKPFSTQQSSAGAVSVESDQLLHEPLEQYRSKELRKEVSRLRLKVNRQGGSEGNDHKHGYIALIREHRRSTSKLSERAHSVANMIVNSVRDSPNLADKVGAQHDDPTIKLVDVLFSEQFWRKFYNLHHTIAQRNRSMLSHTVTIPSIDMYSPLQSNESLRFWDEVAGVLRGTFNAGGNSFLNCTPMKLFNTWRELCAAFNCKAKDRLVDQSLMRQLAYLSQSLKRRPALVSLVAVGSFYSTSAPTVPVEPPQIAQPVRIADEDDDLAVITDDDDIENDINQGTATQPSTASFNRRAELRQRRRGAGAAVDLDSEVASLQREFWRSKKELVLQNIANAKLQFSILQTRFMEEQLCGSKRKIQVLQEELRRVGQNSYAAKEINEELSFCVRKKRRMLDNLIRMGQQ